MASFILLAGAGSDGWYWHRVVPLLERAGHRCVAVDLPYGDEAAGLTAHVEASVSAVGAPGDDTVVVVAQSIAGFIGPLVAERLAAQAIVLVNAMVPLPGETAGAWWDNTGAVNERLELAAALGGPAADDEFDPAWWFGHDLPADVAAEVDRHVVPPAERLFADPFPLPAWPPAATHAIVSRDDRFFPAEFQRRVLQERLGLTAWDLPGGHLPALARPGQLADLLLSAV